MRRLRLPASAGNMDKKQAAVDEHAIRFPYCYMRGYQVLEALSHIDGTEIRILEWNGMGIGQGDPVMQSAVSLGGGPCVLDAQS